VSQAVDRALHQAIEQATGRVDGSVRSLGGQIDRDLDEIGQRIATLASVVEQSLSLREAVGEPSTRPASAATPRPAAETADRLARLRDAAASVSEAVRAEAQRRRARRPPDSRD
jgi:hypothetical protein